MTVLVDGCLICNGRGQVAEGTACPVCEGTGVAAAEQSAAYRQLLVDAAVKAATERFAQAGTAAAEGVLRDLAQARTDAEETTARAGQVLDALVQVRALHLATNEALQQARAVATPQEQAMFTPFSLPVTPPGSPVQPIPGATRDPVWIIDSLYVRELDVWGPLNAPNFTALTNPMTTLGDIITGGSGGTPTRLAIGGANQVLTVVGGVPVWANSAAGFANPMTTTGDIIISNPGATPVRLAIGGAGQVLTVSGGLPSWQNSPAGFANPMTTTGDIIVANPGGTPTRLPIGTAGKVLSVVGGLPAWVTNPSGFTNPMTTTGDMITATTGGAAVRLGAGGAGTHLAMGTSWSGTTGSPGWITEPWQVVPPSADVTGAQDITNILAACTAMSNAGTVYLLPNSTYYFGAAGISVPPYVDLRGDPQTTIINCVGGGTGTYITQFNPANPQTYTRLSGGLHNFIVDGTGAGNGAVGVSLQDVNSEDIRIAVRNFTGTGSIGVQIANNTHSLNNLTGFCRVENCSTCLQFTTFGAQTAIEHIYVAWNLVVNSGQNAMVLAASTGVQGSDMIVDVGVLSNTAGPIITFGTGCIFTDCRFLLKAELNAPAGTVSTVSFNGSGSGFQRTTGILFFGSHILPSNVVAANGTVAHFGTIINDSSMVGAATPPVGLGTYDLSTIVTPALPGVTGTPVANATGIPVMITVAGGTLSAATTINAVAVGDTNTRVFLLPRTQSIVLNWSVSPTGWTWQPMG